MRPDSPFGERYDVGEPLWLDGPHGGLRALDRTSGREVVVNFPYRPDDDHRFLQRAQIRARLRHANLIPLYDLGTTRDGRPFFTEPYIKDTDIRTLHDGDDEAGGMTLPRLVGYLRDACKAVAFLHANGFLHLKMHPGNVLVAAESGGVFVVRGHRSLPPVCIDSDGGMVSGRPAYMAPEQVNPEGLGTPDVLTDVYGLGGILFEILYDSPPNGKQGAPVPEILAALVAREGPPPRRTLSARTAPYRELAQRLEPVCLRALEHDRTARQVSVSAFIKDIEQCVP